MEDVPERRSQFDKHKKLIRRPPEVRLKEGRPCTHPDPYQQPCPWTIAMKLLTKSPKLDTEFWEARACCVPPLPGKAIKLFFSTSSKTLSPRFNSALLHRGRVLGIIKKHQTKSCSAFSTQGSPIESWGTYFKATSVEFLCHCCNKGWFMVDACPWFIPELGGQITKALCITTSLTIEESSRWPQEWAWWRRCYINGDFFWEQKGNFAFLFWSLFSL